MAAKKRRTRSPHPGVVLLNRTLPSGRKAVQARFCDPDSGKLHKPLLDLTALPTQEARRVWAIRKSKELARRRMELESGASLTTSRGISQAIASYLESSGHRLRDRTLVTYRLAIDPFHRWCNAHGTAATGDITRAKLAAFRDTLIAKGKAKAVKGGRRGSSARAEQKRSPVSVNRELRSLKTLLNAWRQAGLLRLTSDDIADALKALPTALEQPEFLTPAQLRKLLEAAQRHDAAVFAETRAEHRGLRPLGSTSRFEPITPFVAFLLLTGCRRGEALGLTWADVDLEALDPQGRAVGEIRLRAANTKTHRARTIGLEVSPALRSMLATLKLRAGRDACSLHVFGGRQPYTADAVDSARARLIEEYGAPKFDWQMLRSTCATYLTNAPGIFGGATVFLSARQLGHSVIVAEKHYLGVHRGIPKDAHTLEAAMQVESQLHAPHRVTPPASRLESDSRVFTPRVDAQLATRDS
jgi:integrase